MLKDMQFESAEPSIVRSVKQRDLLNTWLRLRTERGGLPPLSLYEPTRLDEEWSDLVRYVIEWRDGEANPVIDSHGSRIAFAYGKAAGTSNKGTYLRDYLPPNMLPIVMPAYDECIRRALPVYTITMVEDVYGRSVDYERLLLPFSDAGPISHILASVKTISEDGSFEIKNLLLAPERNQVVKVLSLIDSNIHMRGAIRRIADDVVEI